MQETPTRASRQLYALAERVVAAHRALPGLCAAMVTGSVARGIADHYSDIDMALFYQGALPDDQALDLIRAALGGSARLWQIGDRGEGTLIDAFELGGVEVQLIHSTVAALPATMAELQRDLKVDTPLAKVLEGVLVCRPLLGAELIEGWRAQAAAFPPALGEAMVRHHMRFFPAWGLMPYLAGRDATIWRHQILVESAHNLLGVLAGLNQVYFSPFQLKRAQRFIGQLRVAPERLGERIEGLFGGEPEAALLELERLVDETLALVAAHMPQVDTSAARRRVGWRRPPWRSEDLAALGR